MISLFTSRDKVDDVVDTDILSRLGLKLTFGETLWPIVCLESERSTYNDDVFVTDEAIRPIAEISRGKVIFVPLVSPVVAVVVVKLPNRVTLDSTLEGTWAGIILVKSICPVFFKLVNNSPPLALETEILRF